MHASYLLTSLTLKFNMDEANNMETLKSLMVNNGDDKSNIFFLKVIIMADLLIRDAQVESILLTAW